MTQNTGNSDASALGAIAHGLLWLGFDRAADEIYAVIENATAEADGREWDDVIAS